MERRRPPFLSFLFTVLVVSVVSAYLCAVVYIITLQLSLPRTDRAYGQSLFLTFFDPFVLIVANTGALVGGLLVFPVALFCLRSRDLLRCGVLVLSLTVAFLVGGTILSPRLGVLGAPVVAVAGLMFCRFARLQFLRPH